MSHRGDGSWSRGDSTTSITTIVMEATEYAFNDVPSLVGGAAEPRLDNVGAEPHEISVIHLTGLEDQSFEAMRDSGVFDDAVHQVGHLSAAACPVPGRGAESSGGRIHGGLESAWLNEAEVYDPVTGAWAATGDMIQARSGHTATAAAVSLFPRFTLVVALGALGSAILFWFIATASRHGDPSTKRLITPAYR